MCDSWINKVDQDVGFYLIGLPMKTCLWLKASCSLALGTS